MNPIVLDVAEFVIEYLNTNLDSSYIYHNYQHTHYVVSKIGEILSTENLTEEDKEIVLLAGWFHDIGYTIDKAKHEDHSIEIARKYLEEHNYNANKIAKVLACIHATKLHEKPNNKLEEIVADADLAHLADTNYEAISENLRLEFANTNCGTHSNEAWTQENINVFNKHKYYTKHANLKWNAIKNENLKGLHRQLKKQIKKTKTNANSDNRSEKKYRYFVSGYFKKSYYVK